MKRRTLIRAAGAIGAVLIVLLVFRRECAYGGGMPGWYRACTCKGIERLSYDRTAADGPRRTICYGVVTARTCYQYAGGPVVPCESLPR